MYGAVVAVWVGLTVLRELRRGDEGMNRCSCLLESVTFVGERGGLDKVSAVRCVSVFCM